MGGFVLAMFGWGLIVQAGAVSADDVTLASRVVTHLRTGFGQSVVG
jgi:hypothetical protein